MTPNTKIKTAVLRGLLLLLITFSVFCFAEWQINPDLWNECTRIFCAVLMGLIVLITCVAISQMEDKKKEETSPKHESGNFFDE